MPIKLYTKKPNERRLEAQLVYNAELRLLERDLHEKLNLLLSTFSDESENSALANLQITLKKYFEKKTEFGEWMSRGRK